MYVKYTENDNYNKDEGVSAKRENKKGGEAIAALVLSICSSTKARKL
jgi:hypothetical protein